MRTIHSGSISGPEAVLVSLISWWFVSSVKDFVLKTLPTLDPCAFMRAEDVRIGRDFVELMEDTMGEDWFTKKFEEDMLADNATAHIYGMLEGHDWGVFARTAHTEIGAIVKSTSWFTRNGPAIKKKKADMKLVTGIMES